MRERLDRLLYSEDDVRRWRASESPFKRIRGELVKLTVEVLVAAVYVLPPIILLTALHPDVTFTYRLVQHNAVWFFLGATAFVAEWIRCWFAD